MATEGVIGRVHLFPRMKDAPDASIHGHQRTDGRTACDEFICCGKKAVSGFNGVEWRLVGDPVGLWWRQSEGCVIICHH